MIAVEDAGDNLTPGERNRLVLRRTLGAVSYLYAAFGIVMGLALLGPRRVGSGLYDSRTFAAILIGHGIILAATGEALRASRGWAGALALLAAGGSAFLAVLDFGRGNWVNGGLDAAYVLITLGILLRTRHSS